MTRKFFPYLYITIIIIVSIISSGCRDQCKGGSGGSLTLKVNIMHHSKWIKGATLKIKYNATEFPGENGNYDFTTIAGNQDSFILVNNLTCGDYYLFGKGIDSTLPNPDKTVQAGISFSTEKETGTVAITLPLTEPHN